MDQFTLFSFYLLTMLLTKCSFELKLFYNFTCYIEIPLRKHFEVTLSFSRHSSWRYLRLFESRESASVMCGLHRRKLLMIIMMIIIIGYIHVISNNY